MENKAYRLPRGIKHALWSVGDAAVYPVVYLATIPLMMHSMGMAVFGLWLLLNSLITIFQLFNFNTGVANLGVVTIRNIAQAKSNNDSAYATDVVNSLLYITTILMLIAAGIGWVLAQLVVRHNWWDVKDVPGINLSLCILLASVMAGLKYFDQLFQSILKAQEHFRLSSVLNMVYRFGSLAITLLLAVRQASLVQILQANVVFYIAYLVAQFCCVRWVMQSWRSAAIKDKKLYKQLLRFSVWPWLQTLIIVLTFQTDRFWVSSYSGIREVSSYGLVSTMFNHIHIILTAMVVWVMPRIALMTSKKDDPTMLYSMVRNVLFGFTVVALLFFYFISPVLFPIWIGAATYAHLEVYIKGFVAFELVFAHTIMPFFYLNAAGKERLAAMATLFYCTASYVLMVAGLLLFHSPAAMVVGMTIAMCITMPVINAIVQQQLYGAYSWQSAIIEMLPMYAAIALIYARGNSWLYFILLPLVAVLLWRSYLSTVFKNKIWQGTM